LLNSYIWRVLQWRGNGFADCREIAALPQEFHAAIFAYFPVLFSAIACNGAAYGLFEIFQTMCPQLPHHVRVSRNLSDFFRKYFKPKINGLPTAIPL